MIKDPLTNTPLLIRMKKYLPHLIAILLFMAFTLIQFSPLFTGKSLNQYDIRQHKGSSKEIADFREKYHEEPLWTNSMFSGMPAYQISVLYSGNWMGSIDKALHAYLPHQAGYMFMYFLGFYILLLCLGINPWLALAGALAYGFSSYFYIIIEVGHNSKAAAISYLPPAIGGLILLLRRKYLAGFALSAMALALEFNANHLQITYYGFLIILFILIGYFFHELKNHQIRAYLKAVAVFAVAVVLAILPNTGNLWCTYEYGKYTTRGISELTIGPDGKPNTSNATSGLDKAYALDYSYGPSETFTFLIPNFKGGASTANISSHPGALNKVNPQMKDMVGQFGSYFGPQEFTAGPVYIGAFIIALSLLALFIVKHPLKWPLVAVTVLTVLLSWGKFFPQLSNLFLDYFPAYNKFRAVSILTVVAELCLPLLAILALDRLISAGKDSPGVTILGKSLSIKQVLLGTFLTLIAFCLLCLVLPETVNNFSTTAEKDRITAQFMQSGYAESDIRQVIPDLMTNLAIARESIFKADVLRTMLFLLAGGLLAFLALTRKIKQNYLWPLLCLLLVADLWPVVWRSLNFSNYVPKSEFRTQRPTTADETILQDKSLNYRVVNIAASPFQDATTSYYHQSIGGYHGAKLKKYHELMEFYLMNEINFVSRRLPSVYPNDSLMRLMFDSVPVLNMLNAKYFIVPTQKDPVVITNPSFFGNAWFVREVHTVPDANAEILGLGSVNTQLCLIQEKNKTGMEIRDTYTADGKISLQSYLPNHLVYETSCSEPQFAVFSEIWYPRGWQAFLDGKPARHGCVNYLLRGMSIPTGKHTVEFKFAPKSYHIGNMIALVGSLLLLLSIAGSVFMIYRKPGVFSSE